MAILSRDRQALRHRSAQAPLLTDTDTDTSESNERRSSVESFIQEYRENTNRGRGDSDDQDLPPVVITELLCEGVLIAIRIIGKDTSTFNNNYHCRDNMNICEQYHCEQCDGSRLALQGLVPASQYRPR
jgi:hypothetical protein